MFREKVCNDKIKIFVGIRDFVFGPWPISFKCWFFERSSSMIRFFVARSCRLCHAFERLLLTLLQYLRLSMSTSLFLSMSPSVCASLSLTSSLSMSSSVSFSLSMSSSVSFSLSMSSSVSFSLSLSSSVVTHCLCLSLSASLFCPSMFLYLCLSPSGTLLINLF